MKILVTGASGFLGRFLCQKLRARGDLVVEVHSKNCDLTCKESLFQFNETFDQIYHLAAWTQAGDFCLYHPGEQWIKNQLINTHVLNWWQQKQPQAKLTAIGTSCSYAPEFECKEENYLLGEPIESLFTYGMTKRMLYVGLKALHKQYGMRYLYLIPSTLYGPGYHTDGRQLHFIFDLIRKIIRGKYENEPVVLWGDGHQRRELVHVNDFIKTMLFIENENEIFNMGAGEDHSIREFAQIICEIVEFPFEEITFDTSKYVGAKSKVLSTEKLGPFKQLSLQEGLVQTVEWFLQNRHKLEPHAPKRTTAKALG
ncbi:MAG: GDP-L-fucose synthase [Chlamydiales bacterium]|nr:GDP-L-fucose synthase [Chlamydiales bacterium]MCH9619517.1 GDP-L-fucose synthase [Chlamydiales bacterium]MCH9623123.1 GDP-L-fucose synthase [Chlamydiales bacterium]